MKLRADRQVELCKTVLELGLQSLDNVGGTRTLHIIAH